MRVTVVQSQKWKLINHVGHHVCEGRFKSKSRIKEAVKLFEEMDKQKFFMSEKIKRKLFEWKQEISRLKDLKYYHRKVPNKNSNSNELDGILESGASQFVFYLVVDLHLRLKLQIVKLTNRTQIVKLQIQPRQFAIWFQIRRASEPERYTAYDGTFSVNKILEFLDYNKFPLVTRLTEMNSMRVYSSLVKLQVYVFSDIDDFKSLLEPLQDVARTFKSKVVALTYVHW
ncbi:hypothetical protein K1719_043247 [Acacia pycnantha]|nr:hypothetical protein K1719_043247 [Acacia pycnantha]